VCFLTRISAHPVWPLLLLLLLDTWYYSLYLVYGYSCLSMQWAYHVIVSKRVYVRVCVNLVLTVMVAGLCCCFCLVM
jgi:hypothetical protein